MSRLAALEAFVMTTRGVAIDDNSGSMETPGVKKKFENTILLKSVAMILPIQIGRSLSCMSINSNNTKFKQSIPRN